MSDVLFELFQRTMSAPAKTRHCPDLELEKSDSKERHSSGDSAISSNDENSAPNNNESTNDVFVDGVATSKSARNSPPIRGILKTSPNRPRCFSESDQASLMTSPSLLSCISIDSSIPEEDESAFVSESGKNFKWPGFELGKPVGAYATTITFTLSENSHDTAAIFPIHCRFIQITF